MRRSPSRSHRRHRLARLLRRPGARALIARALENNRDLRVAVLNVERARALYRIQRADRFPPSAARRDAHTLRRRHAPRHATPTRALGITEFEIDLFGRVRDLEPRGAGALLRARGGDARSAQLALVAEVANAWLTLAADRELERVARATLATQEATFRLTQSSATSSAPSRGSTIAQVRTVVETARADAARYEGQVARDVNALTLLVGAPVDPALLPEDFGRRDAGCERACRRAAVGGAAAPPRRPRGRTGCCARPTRTSAPRARRSSRRSRSPARSARPATSSRALFKSGTFAWSVAPRISVPIFQGGRLQREPGRRQRRARHRAGPVRESRSRRAFREVADALALAGTLAEQRAGAGGAAGRGPRRDRLSRARYEAGRDSYLVAARRAAHALLRAAGRSSPRAWPSRPTGSPSTRCSAAAGEVTRMTARRRPRRQGGARSRSARSILDAAKKCFIEHGFHAASMANIAETAGMSPGLIYRYFENKERDRARHHRRAAGEGPGGHRGARLRLRPVRTDHRPREPVAGRGPGHHEPGAVPRDERGRDAGRVDRRRHPGVRPADPGRSDHLDVQAEGHRRAWAWIARLRSRARC